MQSLQQVPLWCRRSRRPRCRPRRLHDPLPLPRLPLCPLAHERLALVAVRWIPGEGLVLGQDDELMRVRDVALEQTLVDHVGQQALHLLSVNLAPFLPPLDLVAPDAPETHVLFEPERLRRVVVAAEALDAHACGLALEDPGLLEQTPHGSLPRA